MSHDTSSFLRLIAPPEAEPLTLSQAKAFLRIEHTAEDAAVTTAITAARQYAEAYLRTALLPQEWEYTVANPRSVILRLPVGPARAISEITLTHEVGDTQAMDAAQYRLSVDGFSLYFEAVPQTEKMAVVYTAGAYEEVEKIPAPIVQGMLHHIAVMLESRDGAAPLLVQSVSCYASFRRVML